MCEDDEQCLYDTAALGSLEIGEKTKNAHRYFRQLHENMKSGEFFILVYLKINYINFYSETLF